MVVPTATKLAPSVRPGGAFQKPIRGCFPEPLILKGRKRGFCAFQKDLVLEGSDGL